MSVDKEDEDSFLEWIERFEELAQLYAWGDAVKLSQLKLRMEGPARAFCRDCRGADRRDYASLRTALTKRFTPVRLGAARSGVFQQRRQKPGESVDQYAQELRRLFKRAYPSSVYSGEAAEAMGKQILVNQFVLGLDYPLKKKLAGVEGSFEEIVCKARFEEARRADLAESSRKERQTGKVEGASTRWKEKSQKGHTHRKEKKPETRDECYKCGAPGHYAQNCPLGGRAQPREAKGTGKPGRPNLPFSGRDNKVNTMGEMLNTLTLTDGQVAALGAVVEAEVELEGYPTKALIDSGSPVTIVALKKLLQVWKDNHPTSDTDKQWLEEAKAKLRDPTVKLVAYGGSPIELLGEAEAKLSVNGVEATVTVLVHEDPSQEILLGTDALAKLDSYLVVAGQKMTFTGVSQAEVKLLKATRLPPRHERAVRVRTSIPKQVLLMEAVENVDTGAVVEPMLVEADEQGEFVVVLKNNREEPIWLEAEQTVGTATPDVTEVLPQQTQTQVNVVMPDEGVAFSRPERGAELLKALGIDATGLALKRRDELAQLVLRYQDVFALDETELGTTGVVKHEINTGNTQPIKQYVRRMPHALRAKVQELVSDMLAKNVIRPTL